MVLVKQYKSTNTDAAVAGVVLSAVSPSGPPLLARILIWAGVAATVKWAAGVVKVKQFDKKLASVGSAVAAKK